MSIIVMQLGAEKIFVEEQGEMLVVWIHLEWLVQH